ncbi:MAG: hypothetical protein QF412_05875 [Planctomycetota bacterium]|jgi:hypothetical protein|nr:hypothetical protein [Planctomycetota bacterium]
MEFLLIPLGIAVVIGIFVIAWKLEQKRREKWTAWAKQNGWSYDHRKDREVSRRLAFLDKLNQGSNRYAMHRLQGEWKNRPAEAFTFHYETHSTDSKGRRKTHHHHVGVVLLRIEKVFPELTIAPEGFLSKIAQAVGYDDIDFESIEFSKKFVVRSEDKKFAYDFCHTRMMEYLLQNPRTTLELDRDILAIYDGNRLEPEEIEPYLDQLHTIREWMPDYLFSD